METLSPAGLADEERRIVERGGGKVIVEWKTVIDSQQCKRGRGSCGRSGARASDLREKRRRYCAACICCLVWLPLALQVQAVPSLLVGDRTNYLQGAVFSDNISASGVLNDTAAWSVDAIVVWYQDADSTSR
ncbi:hypothetical protein GJAV_G00217090 [Gymnothorax javanicus]|nr:hypothetical protein GJAV_G00217090 [Gymnothorax javanicus]